MGISGKVWVFPARATSSILFLQPLGTWLHGPAQPACLQEFEWLGWQQWRRSDPKPRSGATRPPPQLIWRLQASHAVPAVLPCLIPASGQELPLVGEPAQNHRHLLRPGSAPPAPSPNKADSQVHFRDLLLLFPKPFSVPLVLSPLPRHGVYLLSYRSGGLWTTIIFTVVVQLPQSYQLPLFKGQLPR